MLKNVFAKILLVSYLFLFGGIGLVGMHFFSNHNASTGGGIPAESTLSVVEGKVVEGRDVTLETKRRRGPNSAEQFYELDVQPTSGQMVKLRLDHDLEQSRIESVLEEQITAKYDATDENITYDIVMNGTGVITYQEMATKAQIKADKQAEFFGDGAMLQAGISWIIMGMIGLLGRHLLTRSRKPAKTPTQDNA